MKNDIPTRVVLVGAGNEALGLITGLLGDTRVDLVAVLDPDPGKAREHILRYLTQFDPKLIDRFHAILTEDIHLIAGKVGVDVIVDSMLPGNGEWAEKLHRALEPRVVKRMSALSARMIWSPKSPPSEAPPAGANERGRVLQSLYEIIQAQNLAIGQNDLVSLILDTAIRSTGADRGSLMLIDKSDHLLKIRVSQGIEEELIPKIRFPLGEGIAGKVAKEGSPILISGKANPAQFHGLRDRTDVQSALSVPLSIEGSVIGVLNVSSSHTGKEFDESDLEFLTELASLEAQIVVRSEEMRELRESVAKLQTTRKVNEQLSTGLPIDERLARVCGLLVEWIPGSTCAIYLSDETEKLVRRAPAPSSISTSDNIALPRDAGLEWWAYQERQPIILKDDPWQEGGERAVRKAYVVVPLVSEEKSIGVLTVQVVRPQGLTEEDESLLKSVVQPIASAVSAAFREESITRYATQVGAINEAGLRLLATEDLDALARMITSSAAMILQCDACVLRLRDPETGRYTIRSYYGSADSKLQKNLFSFDKNFVIQLLRSREALLVADVKKDPQLAQDGAPVRTALGVPMRHPNGTLGTLALYDKLVPTSFYPVAFTQEDRAVFLRFAGYVERALMQATFLERARKGTQLDEATGLPNRALLDRRLRDEIERSQQNQGKIALMTCQISNHADFIDRLGEEAGRRLIIKVSEILRDNLRSFDVVARIANLSFGILLPDPGVDVRDTATRLTRSLNDAIQADLPPESAIPVQLQYGFASYPEDGETAETLWEKAEKVRITTH